MIIDRLCLENYGQQNCTGPTSGIACVCVGRSFNNEQYSENLSTSSSHQTLKNQIDSLITLLKCLKQYTKHNAL